MKLAKVIVATMAKTPGASNRWRVQLSCEANKLSSKESDWKLAGTTSTTSRTRHGGNGRPNFQSRRLLLESLDDDSSHSETETTTIDAEDVAPEGKKPAATRVLLEAAALEKTILECGRCKECNKDGTLQVEMKTVCLATRMKVSCKDPTCSFLYCSDAPAATSIHMDNDDSYERTTDYAVNVLYAIGFLSCGDGSHEAARLLGLLGLPNDTTMETRSISIIEDRVGPFIRDLATEIMAENLTKEVRLTFLKSANHDNEDFQTWCRSIDKTVATVPLNDSKRPLINVSYDMGWQKRSSGHLHDSPSGHGLFFGKETRKPLLARLKSKLCNYCKSFERKHPDTPVPAHQCCKNHDGSSGLMEAHALLEMVTSMHDDWNCIVNQICCDDDSTVRSYCQWNNANYLKNYNTDTLPQVPIRRGINKGKLQD